MSTPDHRVSAIAKFFVEEAVGLPIEVMSRVVARRWPDATQAEVDRAVSIAREIIIADATALTMEADALTAELRRREAAAAKGGEKGGSSR